MRGTQCLCFFLGHKLVRDAKHDMYCRNIKNQMYSEGAFVSHLVIQVFTSEPISSTLGSRNYPI